MSASIDPTTANTPALSEPVQPPIHNPTPDDPIDPVDAWMNLHSDTLTAAEPQSGDERVPGRIAAARQLVSWRTLEPRLEWVQWYVLIGAALLLVCIVAGTFGWPLCWTVAGITMTLWPMVGLQHADRRRLIVASAMLLAALLIAWRLDAHTNLGALALVGNEVAIIGIAVLAAILGAFTGTRRWLVVQSGIWCLALAGSGWWLTVQLRSLRLLSEWQQFLPDKQAKQLFAAPIPEPFEFGGVIWLTLAAMVLFATGAYAGISIGKIIKGNRSSISFSTVSVVTLAVWLGGLLTPDGKKIGVGAFLLVLALFAGTRANGFRELIQFPAALGAGVLTREALEVAWNGLQAWWGPVYCDDFLFRECRPSGDLTPLIAGCGLLLGVAALGYYGRQRVTRCSR